KAIKIDEKGDVLLPATPQASRHDKPDQQADPPTARDRGAVQDRRRQDQKILFAQRLMTRWPPRRSAKPAEVKGVSPGTRQTRCHRARQAQKSIEGRQGLLRTAQE